MNSRNKKLLTETFWFAIGNFGSKILTLLLVPIYTNVLTTEEYGIIDIIVTTINISIPILTLSIQNAAFRFAMEKDRNKKEIASNCLLVTLFSLPISLILFPFYNLILPQATDYWLYFVLIFFSNALVGTISYYVKGIDKSSIYAIQGAVYTLCFAISNILFLTVFKLGIRGYLLSTLLANVVSLLYLLSVGRIVKDFSLKYIKKSLVVEMIRYCVPLIPASVAWWLMTSIDKYMLLYMCGTTANGLYGVAHKIPAVISVLTSFFINAWQISSIRNKDDEDISEFSSKIFNVLVVSGLLITFVIVIFSQVIGKIFFANDFYLAWKMSPCLTAGTVISVFAGFIGAQFTAEKRTDLHLKSNILAMVSNVILNFVLIKIFGINGAVYGTMLSYFIVFVYRMIKVESFMHFYYSRPKLYIALILLMAAAAITSFAVSFYFLYSIAAFIVVIVIYFKDIKCFLKDIFAYILSFFNQKKSKV